SRLSSSAVGIRICGETVRRFSTVSFSSLAAVTACLATVAVATITTVMRRWQEGKLRRDAIRGHIKTIPGHAAVPWTIGGSRPWRADVEVHAVAKIRHSRSHEETSYDAQRHVSHIIVRTTAVRPSCVITGQHGQSLLAYGWGWRYAKVQPKEFRARICFRAGSILCLRGVFKEDISEIIAAGVWKRSAKEQVENGS